MTSLGAGAPLDYIVESMFDPNAKIKENYHSIVLVTLDGKIVTGIDAGSNADEFVLRDATGKLIRIAKDDVDESKNGQSLMPAGLLDRLEQKDQVDLISFLSKLGKPGAFDASRQNVARLVEVFAATHRTEQKGHEDLISGKDVPGWKLLGTRVNGEITKEMLNRMTAQSVFNSLVGVFIRTEIQSSGAAATFQLKGLKSAELWVDGVAVEKQDDENEARFKTNLKSGKHTVLIRINALNIPESLTIQSDGVTFGSNEK